MFMLSCKVCGACHGKIRVRRSSLEAGRRVSKVCKANNLLHKNYTFLEKVLVRCDTFGIFTSDSGA